MLLVTLRRALFFSVAATAGLTFLISQTRTVTSTPGQAQLVIQSGHTGDIAAIDFSPDSRLIVTAAADPVVRLWSIDTGMVVRTFEGHTARVSSVRFFPDGNSVVTGSQDRSVRIWNIRTGTEIQRFTETSPITAIAIAPTGDSIAVGSGKIVHLWDLTSGKTTRALEGHDGVVNDVAFSPDGSLLATAGGDRTARLWDTRTGRELANLRGHGSAVNAVAFTPDGSTLLTGSGSTQSLEAEHSVRFWSIESRQEIKKLETQGAILALTFSRNGKYLATAGGTGGTYLMGGPQAGGCETRVLELPELQEVRRFRSCAIGSATVSPVRTVAISPNGAMVGRAAYEEMYVTDISTGKDVARLRGAVLRNPTARLEVAAGAVFVDNSGIWDRSSGKCTRIFPGSAIDQFGGFSSDGSTLAAKLRTMEPSMQSSIGIWDVRLNRELGRISRSAASLRLSPDGKWCAVRVINAPLCLIDVASGKETRCAQDDAGAFDSAALVPSPGNIIITTSIHSAPTFPTGVPTLLLSGGGAPVAGNSGQAVANPKTTVRVRDASTLDELRTFEIDRPSATAISPGKEVFAANSGNTYLYNWTTGQQIKVLQTGPASSLSFSPDDRYLVLAGSEGTRVWDTQTERETMRIGARDGRIATARFTSDGKYVFHSILGGDTTLWEVSSGRKLATLLKFSDNSWAVIDGGGRYDSSNPDESIGLHWVAGQETFVLGKFKDPFYTPGLLSRILNN